MSTPISPSIEAAVTCATPHMAEILSGEETQGGRHWVQLLQLTNDSALFWNAGEDMLILSANPKVDAYLEKARPFAQPILSRLRELVHKACPEVEETIKWSRPFFEYRGVILCNMSAFKEHCSFAFWGEEIGAVLREAKVMARQDGMGSFGRITSVEDLPPAKQLLAWLRQAAAFVDSGQYTSPIAARRKVVKLPKPPLDAPAEFSSALRENKKASAAFAAFSPSCQREYVEWIAEAKRPETRDKRIATAIEWMAEGKTRHWKYENC